LAEAAVAGAKSADRASYYQQRPLWEFRPAALFSIVTFEDMRAGGSRRYDKIALPEFLNSH